MTSTTAAPPTPPLELEGKAIDAWVAATVKERGVVGASLVKIRQLLLSPRRAREFPAA